jgi:hypothetical protein
MRGVRPIGPGVAAALALLLAGCGGNGGGAGTTESVATATAMATTATAAAPSNGALALKRYEFMGVTALVPGGWNEEPNEEGVVLGAPDDKGAMGFFVREDPHSPDEWIDRIVLDGYSKKVKVVRRERVRYPTIGRGVLLTLRQPPNAPIYNAYAATIDGLLVELTLFPADKLTRAQVEEILLSLRRKV